MKAIIFDVDGVLLKNKDEHGKYLWQKNIATDLGLNQDQMRQIYAKDWFLVIKGLVDTRQHFKTVFKNLNIDISVDVFIEYWLTHDLEINIEIIPIIKSIKKPKLYIGTNQDQYRTAILQKTFAPYFDKIFSSYHIGAIKPEPEYYKYIEANLNLQSKDIAFIDDSKSHVEAAAQQGWTCHHYQDIKGLKNFIQNHGEILMR